MPDFPVNPNTWKTLEDRLNAVGVHESDLEERFVRSGGAGGQNVNKVSSCVILVHVPSGMTVRCQEERSQAMNRFRARQRLAEKMEVRLLGAASAKRQKIEKIRRQKRRRSRRAKEKMLADKRHVSQIKETRRAPDFERAPEIL
ncbi:MAG: peptide chain release factor-like protein [Elusimicrobia bacterium]|nr:peptide chain release factor-like protein [Elusimicrobiota bacterium]